MSQISVQDKAVIWVHEEALFLDPNLLEKAGEGARKIFIWDETDFKTRTHSFKKLVFFYEALEERGVEIIKGETADILIEACSGGQSLYFIPPSNPELAALLEPVKNKIDLRPIERPTLGDTEFTPNMKRFFRYWNKAKRQIMSAQQP